MLFFSTFFLFIAIFPSGIAILGTVEEVTIGKVNAQFFLTGSYLLNQTFFDMAYSFYF